METVAVVEKIVELPNPHIKREQCVQECMGCNRMFSSMNMWSTIRTLDDGEHDDVIGDVCVAYVNPKAIQNRMGKVDACGLASNKTKEDEGAKKKINPLKASKRGRR